MRDQTCCAQAIRLYTASYSDRPWALAPILETAEPPAERSKDSGNGLVRMDRLSALPWAQEQSSLGIFISRALRYGDAQSLCAASRTIKARGARHGDADATLTHLCAQVHVLTSVEAECRARWCVEGEQAVLAHIARSQNRWGRLQRWGEVRAPVGTWEGVTTNAQGRVTEIGLYDKNLRGARGVLSHIITTTHAPAHRRHPGVDRQPHEPAGTLPQ